MARPEGWEELFKAEKFADHYKTGEKITGQFAKDLLDQSQLVAGANANPDKPLVVLDNACGTGVISSILQRELSDPVKNRWSLTCGDFSSGMLELTKRRMEHEGWVNAEAKLVDAQDTKLPSAYYTHVITAFAFMALPRSMEALDETCRILQPGGTLACSTWIGPGWVPVIKKAMGTIPGNLPFPTADEFLNALGSGEWNSTTWISDQLSRRGLEDVSTNVVVKNISISVPELLETTMIMFPMVKQNFWTADQQKEHEKEVRPALQKYLVDTYGEDGDVPMVWTAILATARKPVVNPEAARA